MGVVRDAFVVAAADLDGSGASVVRAAEGVDAAMQDALTTLEAEQRARGRRARRRDRARRISRPRCEHAGEAPRRAAQASTPACPHCGAPRGHHRARDSVPRRVGGARRVASQHRPSTVERVGARACAQALDACSAARAAFEFNPSESLLLELLLLQLPGSSAGRANRLSSFAGVAQSVEQLTRNEQVRGSNPLPGSTPSEATGSTVKRAQGYAR